MAEREALPSRTREERGRLGRRHVLHGVSIKVVARVQSLRLYHAPPPRYLAVTSRRYIEAHPRPPALLTAVGLPPSPVTVMMSESESESVAAVSGPRAHFLRACLASKVAPACFNRPSRGGGGPVPCTVRVRQSPAVFRVGPRQRFPNPGTLCASSPRGGGAAASGLLDGTVRVWDVPLGSELAAVLPRGGGRGLSAVALGARHAAAALLDGTVRVWGLAGFRCGASFCLG